MITINPKDIYSLDDSQTGYHVYVFRRGGNIIYVGESTEVQSRLHQHLTFQRSNSWLSEELKTGLDEIEIDLYEGRDIIDHKRLWNYVKYIKHTTNMSIPLCVLLAASEYRKDFERYLIRTLKPSCNYIHNTR